MDLLKALPIILIVFVSGCTTGVSRNTQQQEQAPIEQPVQETTPVQQPTEGTLQGEVTPPPAPQEQPTSTAKEYTMEYDESGYYTNGQKTPSISVKGGDSVKITYQVRSTNVYPGGAQFRGCGATSASVPPGGTTSIQFTASSTCTITAYWPDTNIAKVSMGVVVS